VDVIKYLCKKLASGFHGAKDTPGATGQSARRYDAPGLSVF